MLTKLDLCAFILLFALAINFFCPPQLVHARPSAPFQSPAQTFVRVINLTTNDLVFNAQTQKLHASVPSSAGPIGNTITDVDPFAGTVGQSVLIGSEPNKLALSDDGQVLYAGIDGAAAIRRFDVATHTPGLQFLVGNDQISNSPSVASDLDVAPGNSNVLAVARTRPGVSPTSGAAAVFDNGVQRPTTAGSINSLTFAASTSTLYGASPFSFLQTFAVDNSGVTFSNTVDEIIGTDIQFENGIVYGSNGKAVNPTTNTLVGTFPGVGTGPFVIDAAAGRAYFITGNSTILNQTITLRAFDLTTFAQVGETTISDVDSTATSLVRWGPNGLAFRTAGNQIFLIQTSLVPSGTPVPSPTPTPSPTATPTPTPSDVSVRRVQLSTNDLIYNSSNQTIYCSVPSSVGPGGNTIAPLNPIDGSIGTRVFVGSEPNKLALTDDNQKLYVGIDGAGSVRILDIATQTPGLQFFLGAELGSSPFRAEDIAPAPGTQTTVAIGRRSPGSSFGLVSVYDNGVRRTNNTSFGPDIEFGASAARFYAAGSFGGEFVRLNVNPSGPSVDSILNIGLGGKLLFVNGLMYTANGSVFDPETGVLKGTFTAPELRNNSIMTVDPALGRAYFLTSPGSNNSTLRVFDINTFQLLGEATIQNTFGFLNTRLVRWGENGLAFRTATQVVLIQSVLVSPSGTVPAPTPTPSPTPVPSPTPQATTFTRLIDLPVNDVVLHTASQTLYASVASSAGVPRGNSITPITPATGALGTSVFVGSEPSRVALSDDGQALYTGLEGAGDIRRFDIASQTAGIQFNMGQEPNFGGQFKANDIAVVPGSPNSIAVARHASSSPPEGGVAIYDNGVMRPTTTPGHIVASSFLAFSQNPSTLYGGGFSSGLNTMTLNASGVTVSSTTQFSVGPYIEFKNNLVYSLRGQIVNPSTGALVGSFTNIPTFAGAMTVDTELGKIFFATDGPSGFVISAYDINTFVPLGQITLLAKGIPTRLLRWGVNGLAVRTFDTTTGPATGRLYLVQSNLVSTAAPIPTGIQASAINGFAFENGLRFDMSVIRTGDLSGSSTVNYSTSDGTASEKSDYMTALGTLRFAPGESSKTVSVFITNDIFQEGTETFNFNLSNATGAELVEPDSTVVSIQDDDFGPPPANPIDGTTFFVRQHYRDFLNRDPDFAGLQFWSNEINSCGADQQCREIKRINVSAAFFQSIEFQETGFLAYRMYKVAYGDTTSPNVAVPVPIIRFREFLNDAQRVGFGVQVLVGDWETQLENNKRDYAREFVVTPRFLAAFPLSMTPAQFVQKLDENAGGVLSTAERQQLEAELTSPQDVTQARGSVVRKVAEDQDLRQRESNRAFVLMQYYGYLRRNADDPQDTDFRGWEFWLTKLNQFNGNFIEAEMVKAFLASIEYRQRFGP